MESEIQKEKEVQSQQISDDSQSMQGASIFKKIYEQTLSESEQIAIDERESVALDELQGTKYQVAKNFFSNHYFEYKDKLNIFIYQIGKLKKKQLAGPLNIDTLSFLSENEETQARQYFLALGVPLHINHNAESQVIPSHKKNIQFTHNRQP